MLSTEGPSGPSSSCQVSAVVREERSLGGEQVDPSGQNLKQSPQFSIRDYVFTTRNKDIRKNWPFPQQHLKLCLKHGVSVLLPPFEPPDSLRSRLCTNSEGSGRLSACVDRDGSGIEPNDLIEKEAACLSESEPNSLEHDGHLTLHPLALESAHQGDKQTSAKVKQNNGFEEVCNDAGELKSGDSNTRSVVTSLACVERSNTNQSGKHCPLASERILETATQSEVCKLSSPENVQNVKDSSGKRFKLIVKLGANPELGRGDEVSSNSSMISDAMASKVCPVCKAFSSTSNTTLNAHIDQCLSKKSHTDQVIDVLSMNKVKPTKKRLMVDIYKTASPCTLEDLDRRNGTTWALDLADLASLPVAGEVCVDKRQKVASVEEDCGRSGKGAVFVDSDGTKVCILSILNAMAPPTPAEPSSSKRPSPVKKDKQRVGLAIGRGRLLAPKPKHMKVRASTKASTKRDESSALLSKGIQEEPYIRPVPDVVEAQPPCERSSFQNVINRKVFGTFKRPFPSKESVIAKKLKGAVAHNAGKNPSSIRSVNIGSCHSHSERSAALKCIELATPIDSASTAKIKNASMLSSSSASGDCVQKQSQSTVDNESSHWTSKFPSEEDLNLKQPKDRLFWVRRRRKAKRTSRVNEKSADCHHPETDASEDPQRPTTQDRRTKLGTSKKASLLPSKLNNRQRKKLILKRLKKCKSTKRTCPTLKDLTPGSNGCLATSSYGAMPVNDVNDPEGSGQFKTNFTIQNHLPDQSTPVAVELKLAVTSTGKDGNYRFEERFNLEGECCNREAADVEMQTEHSVDPAGISKSSFNRDPHVAGENIASEGLLAASDSSLKSWARLVENDSFVPGSEVWAEAHDRELFDNQMMLDNGTGNENAASGNPMLGDGGFRDSADACRNSYYMECQTNAQQVLGSSTCQSSSTNTGAEVPQGNSSVTSIRIVKGDHNVASEREPCGSPVSDASNVSHPSAEELKEQTSEVVFGERLVAEEIGGRSKLADAWEPGPPRKKRYYGGCDQEMIRTAMGLGWHHGSFWPVNQPCCCSRREAVSTESLLPTNQMVPQMTLPTNTRHMAPNLQLFGELIASPFRSCPRSRAETAAHETVQSLPDYVLQRAHLRGVESCTPSGHVGASCETEQQAVPNPVLRLMGKDVLVVNKDEEHVRHQNTAPFSSSFPASSMQYPSSFIACHQSMEGWKIAHSIRAHQAASANSGPFMGMPLNGSLDSGDLFHTLQNRRARCDNTEKSHHVPDQSRKVIVIDDSEADPEPENALPSPASTLSSTVRVMDVRQVQPPSYFYPQYSHPTRGLSGRWMPGFHNVCSPGIADSSEGRGPRNPSPLPHPQPAQFYFKS